MDSHLWMADDQNYYFGNSDQHWWHGVRKRVIIHSIRVIWLVVHMILLTLCVFRNGVSTPLEVLDFRNLVTDQNLKLNPYRKEKNQWNFELDYIGLWMYVLFCLMFSFAHVLSNKHTSKCVKLIRKFSTHVPEAQSEQCSTIPFFPWHHHKHVGQCSLHFR